MISLYSSRRLFFCSSGMFLGSFTVLGSTNWTYHAVEENNETAVIIESADINRHYAEFIDLRIAEGTPYVP